MISIDENEITLTCNGKEIDLYSKESFEIISKLWLKIGWVNKYCHKFSWLGRPILQLPEDMIKIQEIIFSVKPTCIIETGVAHGGSLIYYASLLKSLDLKSQVIGIELDLNKEIKNEIEHHPLASYINLVEGDSIDPSIIDQVNRKIINRNVVLVILDSCHTKEHVLNELRHYQQFVSIDSYIIAADGIIKEFASMKENPWLLHLRPEGVDKNYIWNNPQEAVKAFLAENENFQLETIDPLYNQSTIISDVSYCPNAYLRRLK